MGASLTRMLILFRYDHLDEVRDNLQRFKAENKEFEDFLKAKIDSFLYGDKDFIYKNDILKVWEDFLAAGQTRRGEVRL